MISDSSKKFSNYPCPICKKLMFIIGHDSKGKKIGSCGHSFSFKKSKSAKEFDKKYTVMPWGLELKKA